MKIYSLQFIEKKRKQFEILLAGEKKTTFDRSSCYIFQKDYFHRMGPLGRFGLVVAMSMCPYICMPLIFVKASYWLLDHMIRSRPLIDLSELCILYENSKEVHNLQSHYGLLDKKAEEVHNLHHNLHSPDGLLDENAEEVHNLQ